MTSAGQPAAATDAAAAVENQLVLTATLLEKQALRYTPAGLPALNLVLQHEGQASEDGQTRKVSMEVRAVGIGTVTRTLSALPLGAGALFRGFLAPARNGRGLVLHITSVEPAARATV